MFSPISEENFSSLYSPSINRYWIEYPEMKTRKDMIGRVYRLILLFNVARSSKFILSAWDQNLCHRTNIKTISGSNENSRADQVYPHCSDIENKQGYTHCHHQRDGESITQVHSAEEKPRLYFVFLATMRAGCVHGGESKHRMQRSFEDVAITATRTFPVKYSV